MTTPIHPSEDPMQLAETAWGRAIGLSPAEQSTLSMADCICNALFGTSTVRETAHSIMRDAKEMTSASPAAGLNGYDYKHQAWIVNGRYVACGHLQTTPCDCYGRTHEGESPAPDADVR